MDDFRKILNSKYHAILTQKGVMDIRYDLLNEWFGVDSSKKLSDNQMIEAISRLSGTTAISADQQLLKLKRSDILKLITGNPFASNPRERGLGVPNEWTRLNPFIKNHAGKYLPSLTMEQLLKFHDQLFAIRDSGWYYGKKEHEALPSAPTTHPQPKKSAPQTTQIAMIFAPTTGLNDLPN